MKKTIPLRIICLLLTTQLLSQSRDLIQLEKGVSMTINKIKFKSVTTGGNDWI